MRSHCRSSALTTGAKYYSLSGVPQFHVVVTFEGAKRERPLGCERPGFMALACQSQSDLGGKLCCESARSRNFNLGLLHPRTVYWQLICSPAGQLNAWATQLLSLSLSKNFLTKVLWKPIRLHKLSWLWWSHIFQPPNIPTTGYQTEHCICALSMITAFRYSGLSYYMDHISCLIS